MLSPADIQGFCDNGFLAMRGVIPRRVIDACADILWQRLANRGIRQDNPASWTGPVVRVNCPEHGPDSEPFAEAAMSPALWEAYDQLIGEERWWKRENLSGRVPVRFPSTVAPADAGWHIESSFQGADGRPRSNVYSRERGLFTLVLFTDVTAADAPTSIRVGSHRDAARALAPAGADGLADSRPLDEASAHRPVEYATGRRGDVFVCHPFLVHSASWPHRGTAPRMVAHPTIPMFEPFSLGESPTGPVEAVIIEALSEKPRLSVR